MKIFILSSKNNGDFYLSRNGKDIIIERLKNDSRNRLGYLTIACVISGNYSTSDESVRDDYEVAYDMVKTILVLV